MTAERVSGLQSNQELLQNMEPVSAKDTTIRQLIDAYLSGDEEAKTISSRCTPIDLWQSVDDMVLSCLDGKTALSANDMEKLFLLIRSGSNDLTSKRDVATESRNRKRRNRPYTRLWLHFVQLKLPAALCESILDHIYDVVLPQIDKPVLLADFFFSCYRAGGSLSICALQGLLILMQRFNLNYPNFYKDLYGILTPAVLENDTVRKTFFKYADIYLSSTHLPAYVVAAFIKRLSRLSLSAPPEALPCVCVFICNMMIRHPSTQCLAGVARQCSGLASDPFDNDAVDPRDSKALDSSLWEIKAMQHHYLSEIRRASAPITKPLGSVEIPLSDFHFSFTDMLHAQLDMELDKNRQNGISSGEGEQPDAFGMWA